MSIQLVVGKPPKQWVVTREIVASVYEGKSLDNKQQVAIKIVKRVFGIHSLLFFWEKKFVHKKKIYFASFFLFGNHLVLNPENDFTHHFLFLSCRRKGMEDQDQNSKERKHFVTSLQREGLLVRKLLKMVFI